MKRYRCTLTATFDLELHDRVLSRKQLDAAATEIVPDLAIPRVAAEHIAYNMVVNGIDLSSIDGFANLPRNAATVSGIEWGCEADEED